MEKLSSYQFRERQDSLKRHHLPQDYSLSDLGTDKPIITIAQAKGFCHYLNYKCQLISEPILPIVGSKSSCAFETRNSLHLSILFSRPIS